ncbi:hypothetical protein ACFFRR_006412 [Megaselia abdita]
MYKGNSKFLSVEDSKELLSENKKTTQLKNATPSQTDNYRRKEELISVFPQFKTILSILFTCFFVIVLSKFLHKYFFSTLDIFSDFSRAFFMRKLDFQLLGSSQKSANTSHSVQIFICLSFTHSLARSLLLSLIFLYFILCEPK